MQEDLKQKWLEALRSGEFKQGRAVLHNTDDNSFCCLGVLCTVDDNVKAVRVNDMHSTVFKFPQDSDGEHTGVLPRTYTDEIGLSPNLASSLMSLNDSAAYNFEKLAEIIEKEA